MIERRSFGRWLVGACALSATLSLGGCGLFRPSEELRYRLAVEVETPVGLKTGYSVIEVRGVKNPDWVNPEGRGWRSSFTGEAVAVDVAPGQTLFALLRTDSGLSDAGEYPWFAFGDELASIKDPLEQMRVMRGWQRKIAEIKGTEELRSNGIQQVPVLPLLVTFGDLKDPASVERVDPANLADSFGRGVRLRRVTVAVTDEAVTVGIGERLAALGIEPDHGLDRAKGVTANPTLGQQLGYIDFRR